MSSPQTAQQILDREFLEMRAKTLELAASLDRLQRAAGNVNDDPRLTKLMRALEILTGTETARAERIQRLFSRPYEADWQEQFTARSSEFASSSR